MKAIIAISFLAAVVTANDKQGDQKKNLPTFREALYNATHNISQTAPLRVTIVKKPTGTSTAKAPHKIFFEVVRISERLMVDQNNHTKGYNANLHSALYTVDSGHLRRLFAQDVKIVPKPGSPIMKAIEARRFIQGPVTNKPAPDGGKGFGNIFDNIYKKLHLGEPIPALIAAILLGFFATAALYGIAYGLLFIFYMVTGYKPVDEDDEELAKNSSEEQMIKNEQKRMEESKPLISKA